MNVPFATAMQQVPNRDVSNMLAKIARALDKRAAFEASKAPHKLHVELMAADKQMRGNKTLARFYAVLDASPDLILNRERKEGYRANLKTVRKVRGLSEFMAGENGKINGVCKALFAATILAARMGTEWVSNNDAEKLLLALPLDSMNGELRDALAELSGLNIRDAKEARNQACQFRTAFENLGCYFVSRSNPDDMNANGIRANLESPLMFSLANRWGL
jgi:hypothetical protein